MKTARQVKLSGGVAGEAFDTGDHKACDTALNLNFDAVRERGGAANAGRRTTRS